MNRGVNPEADIEEAKSLFADSGHDHTGGTQGAVIDVTENLISNGNFEHTISSTSSLPSPSGYPDFWLGSGTIEVELVQGAYIGSLCCSISNPLVGSYPSADECIYQNIPSPSGQSDAPSPSGTDFAGRTLTLGCWYRSPTGTGTTLYLGYDDGTVAWATGVAADSTWRWTTYEFECSDDTTNLRVLFCPEGNIYIDNAQLAIGTRLLSTRAFHSEADQDVWRKVNAVFNNGQEDPLEEGDVVVVSPSSYAAVVHPQYYGQGGAMGVVVAPSASGSWVGVCRNGPVLVNVIQPVAPTDLLCTAAHSNYPGYAISENQIGVIGGITLGETFAFATALQEKVDDGPGQVLAFVHPKPSRTTSIARKAIHMAPVFPGAVEGSDAVDDSAILLKGYDGEHNYYEWNWASGDASREFIFDASGNLRSTEPWLVSGVIHSSGYIDIIGGIDASGDVTLIGIMTASGTVPVSGDINVADIMEASGSLRITEANFDAVGVYVTSDLVYQEGLLIGSVGKLWGSQVDRVKVKFLSDAAYEDEQVEDNALGNVPGTGAVFPAGWTPVGFDLRDGTMSGVITVDTPASEFNITSSGTYPIVTSGVFTLEVDVSTAGEFILDSAPAQITGDYELDGDGFISGAYVSGGVGLHDMSGWFRKEGVTSVYNSVVVRIPIPHDFLYWVSGVSYIWNKADTNATVSYYIYDISGVLIASGVDMANTDWTKTTINIPVNSGTWTPNEWFTMKNILTSNDNTSAYLGEIGFYYQNYTA